VKRLHFPLFISEAGWLAWEKPKNSKMARGSKPGERRGGRQRGTLNKKTVLKNAAIKAVAADPNLSPLDYFRALMNTEELPLPTRVAMASKALPYLHAKRSTDEFYEDTPKQGVGSSNGGGVDAKWISKERKATTDFDGAATARRDASPALMPLDFLLGVMRSPETPPALGLKVACITTPYVHKKRATGDLIGRTAGKPDQYDFVVDRATAKEIRDDNRRLVRVLRTRPKHQDKEKRKARALAARLDSRLGSLIGPCPTLYGTVEHERDQARLLKLRKRRSRTPLNRAEDAEEAHLTARSLTYKFRPEAIARAQIAELELRQRLTRHAGKPPLSPQEESCLRGLRTLFPKELPFLSDHHAENFFASVHGLPVK
jgi:hypothetical protein